MESKNPDYFSDIKKRAKKWIVSNLLTKKHFVESTAIVTAVTPLAAFLEVLVLDNDISINARLSLAALTYGGFGYAICKGRDYLRKVLNITEITTEKIQKICDGAMGLGFGLITGPFFYYLAGERDPQNIALASFLGSMRLVFEGIACGYAIDFYKDLSGIQESKRIPSKIFGLDIKNKSPKFKKSLLALATAGSIALTSGIYHFIPDKKKDVKSYNEYKKDFQTEIVNNQDYNYES